MVFGDVSGARSEHKVFKAVVVLDLVEVVHVFVFPESAPKMLFHDVAMLQDVEAASGELNVPVSPDASSDRAIPAFTRAETHVASCGAGWFDGESSSARFAGESDSHSSAPIMW